MGFGYRRGLFESNEKFHARCIREYKKCGEWELHERGRLYAALESARDVQDEKHMMELNSRIKRSQDTSLDYIRMIREHEAGIDCEGSYD